MIAQLDSTYIRARPLKALSRLLVYALMEGRPLTTRGRWINPLIFSQFFAIKHLPLLQTVQSPIYILGTGRNGSTLLGRVLSLHPSVCFLNEPKAQWYSAHPHADIIGSYSRGSARIRLGSADASPYVGEKLRRLYGYSLRVTGSSRILDKNSESIFRVPFIKSIFPDARFIFLIRNGRDVIKSIEKWSNTYVVKKKNNNAEIHDWWGREMRKWKLLIDELVHDDEDLYPYINNIRAFVSQHDMAAVEWILTAKYGSKLLRDDSECVHLIRYEDLLEDSEKVLSDVFAFCNLPNDEKVHAYAHKTFRKSKNSDIQAISPIIEPIFCKLQCEFGYM